MSARAWVTVAGLLALTAGCSWSAGGSTGVASLERLPQPPASVAPAGPTTTAAGPATTASATEQECTDRHWATASYTPEPLGDAPFVEALRERGRLRVGVDENTLGFAARNSTTGSIEGFEVELAKAIGGRLFPDGDVDRVELVPLVTDQKTRFVASGDVDMTISAVSMTCARWADVAFSAEYYTALQQFLVRRDSPIHERSDLDGTSVCVTTGSSSKRILEQQVPAARLVEVPDRTGCLLKLQEGDVDAYFGHDSFLYGMLVQDPTLEIRTDVLPDDVTVSHYGIAIGHDHLDLVRLVNAVLESMRADGSWNDLHRDLQETLPALPAAEQPIPVYRDAP